jgi:hypothetical protein
VWAIRQSHACDLGPKQRDSLGHHVSKACHFKAIVLHTFVVSDVRISNRPMTSYSVPLSMHLYAIEEYTSVPHMVISRRCEWVSSSEGINPFKRHPLEDFIYTTFIITGTNQNSKVRSSIIIYKMY